MTKKRNAIPAVLVTSGTILVGGCGGHGNSNGYAYAGSSCGYYGSCSAYNAYQGTLSNPETHQITPVVAIIDRNGNGRMSGGDGTYYRLNVESSRSTLRGEVTGLSDTLVFPNGGQSTADSIAGQVSESAVSAAMVDQQNHVATLTLNSAGLSAAPSSLSTLAGVWSYSAKGFNIELTIQPDGSFSGTDSQSCTYSGSFGLADAKVNVYQESHTRDCAGATDPFNGLAARIPAATSGPAASDPRIKVMTDDGDGQYLSITLAKSS